MSRSNTPSLESPGTRHRLFWASALVLAWGLQAIVIQSLLLREALVLMFGSEFAWGVVLFAWLLGVAVGAGIGGKIAERLGRADVAVVLVLMALGVMSFAELWVFRSARPWLGVEPGEFLPLPQTAAAAILLVAPTSALVGLTFPLVCRIGCEPEPGATRATTVSQGISRPVRGLLSFGTVYALEAAGSLIGGAVFSFWAIEHLTPVEIVLACSALTAAASAGLLAAPPQRSLGAIVPGAVGLVAVLVLALGSDALHRRLAERRWRDVAPGYELIAETESKYQNLAVGHRAGQFTLYCDGQVAADFPDPYTFAPLAHFWLCQHPAPRRVLLLGGGAEGLLAEILRHPVEHVDYVELDPQQIDLVESLLPDADQQALGDPRVTLHYVDARYYVKTQQNRFDLVIARLPEPTSAQRARFYTAEFYAELRRAMTPRAVLCLTAAAAPGELSGAAREYLASVRLTLRTCFPEVIIGWGDPAQILAATESGLTAVDPEESAARYAGRGVESSVFHPAWFSGATDWLNPDKLARREAELDAEDDAEVSTDLRPAIYVQRLALWDQMTGGSMGRTIRGLRSVQPWQLAAAVLVAAGVTLVWSRARHRCLRGWTAAFIMLSVASTGFATMALTIVWLFGFQNLYGYVYQRIGWIIALFMGGLVVGCALGNWGSRRSADSPGPAPILWRRLVAVDLLLALWAGGVPFLLPVLAVLQSGPGTFVLVECCVSFMVAVTGLLGGAAFVLAGRLRLGATGRAAAAAGSIVSADHAGACLGALLCGILLVPVFGTATTALFLAGMKLSSAGLVALGYWSAREA